MKKLFLILISLMLFQISALELKTDLEKVSYSLGIFAWHNQQKATYYEKFDFEAFITVIEDTYNSEPSFFYKETLKEKNETNKKIFELLDKGENADKEIRRGSYLYGVLHAHGINNIALLANSSKEKIIDINSYIQGIRDYYEKKVQPLSNQEADKLYENFLKFHNLLEF